MHTHSLITTRTYTHTHAHTHKRLGKKKKLSQINIGKVWHIHVIYPKFIKQNRGSRSHWIKMEKYAEVHWFYCSFTPSWIQNSGEEERRRRERREKEGREAPVLRIHSRLIGQGWLTPDTSGDRALPSAASLLLTLHLYPAVLRGEEEAEEEEGWGRGEIRQAVQGCGWPFHCKSVGPGVLGCMLACGEEQGGGMWAERFEWA